MTIHPMTPPEFAALPKFLACDNCDFTPNGREFVLHCHYARFIVEFIGDIGKPLFIDKESEFINLEVAAGRAPAQTLADLVREAEEFFNT